MEATGGKIFENPGVRGILKKGYSEKQDNNEKTHIMNLGNEEKEIRDMKFNDPDLGGILKKNMLKKKKLIVFRKKGGMIHQTSGKI